MNLKAALAKLDGAQKAQRAVESAILEAEQNLARRGADLSAANPDDEAALAALVSKQDAARGRITALTGKLDRAKGDVESARVGVEDARALRAAELAADFKREDEAARAVMIEAADRLRARITRLQELRLAHSEEVPGRGSLHSVFFEYGTPFEICARNRLDLKP